MSLLEEANVPDITASESSDDRSRRLSTSRDLYHRWERQQWAVAAVDVERDAAAWAAMRPFYRTELLTALTELEVGEVCVTNTLGALVEGAEDFDDRIYLCTQLADEARHVRFFQAYLTRAAGVDAETVDGQQALDDVTDYGRVFAPVLARATAAARGGGNTDQWYAAVVLYHLITEGVLAATALRNTRELVRTLPLPALAEGLTNVIRDESRHVGFGMWTARQGVAGGHAEPVWRAYAEGIDLAGLVLIGPSRYSPVPVIRQALAYRVAQLDNHIGVARDRVVQQIRHIGLGDRAAEAAQRWDRACAAAIDAYEEQWQTHHPLRAGKRGRVPTDSGGDA